MASFCTSLFFAYKIQSISGSLLDARSFYESGIGVQEELEEQLRIHQEQHEGTIKKLFSVRPKLDEIVSFLEEMEKINEDVRVKSNLKSIDKNDLTDPADVSEYIKYQLVFSTTIDKTVEYIEALNQRLPYYIKVDNIYIKQDLENLPPGIYKVTLIIKLYTE